MCLEKMYSKLQCNICFISVWYKFGLPNSVIFQTAGEQILKVTFWSIFEKQAVHTIVQNIIITNATAEMMVKRSAAIYNCKMIAKKSAHGTPPAAAV